MRKFFKNFFLQSFFLERARTRGVFIFLMGILLTPSNGHANFWVDLACFFDCDWVKEEAKERLNQKINEYVSNARRCSPLERDPISQITVETFANNFRPPTPHFTELNKIQGVGNDAVNYVNKLNIQYDKTKHCLVGDYMYHHLSYDSAVLAGYMKELKDGSDCNSSTHFEVGDFLATKAGAEASKNGLIPENFCRRSDLQTAPGQDFLTAASNPIKGNISGFWRNDQDGSYHIVGWACQPLLSKSIVINLYDSDGHFIKSSAADQKNEPAVASMCKTQLGSHRFDIQLTSDELRTHAGKTIRIKSEDGQVLTNSDIFIIPSESQAGLQSELWFNQLLNIRANLHKHATKVPINCSVERNNWGCRQVVSCPAGMTIRSVKAACNLEYGSVPSPIVSGLIDGALEVFRGSDNQSDGHCALDELDISGGMINTVPINGRSQVTAFCKEYDKNGGDCHILGEMLCQ